MRQRMMRCAGVFALGTAGCVVARGREPEPPRLLASGMWTGAATSPDDSAFSFAATISGRAMRLVVDYGSSVTALTDRTFDSLHLPRPYAKASRVQKMVRAPGVKPVFDSTASAVVQQGDTITQYWGDFEPFILDSLRLGTLLVRHVFLPGELSYATHGIDGVIGRDILSSYDVEFDGPGRAVRLYQRTLPDTSTGMPRWLPPGVRSSDCVHAAAEQTNLRFPVLVDGHPINATFGSGTGDATINLAEAYVLGLTPPNRRVRPDSASPLRAWVANDVVLRVGGSTLHAPNVWITDDKFIGDSSYRTTPSMLLGLAQFRDRTLFLSHSTGTVCIGPTRP